MVLVLIAAGSSSGSAELCWLLLSLSSTSRQNLEFVFPCSRRYSQREKRALRPEQRRVSVLEGPHRGISYLQQEFPDPRSRYYPRISGSGHNICDRSPQLLKSCRRNGISGQNGSHKPGGEAPNAICSDKEPLLHHSLWDHSFLQLSGPTGKG